MTAKGAKKTALDADPFFERLTAVYLACLALGLVLYTGGGYDRIIQSKTAVFFLLTGGYVLVSLLGRLELALVGQRRFTPPPELWRSWGLPQRAVFVYWCAVVVSTMLSVSPGVSLWGGERCEGLLSVTLCCAGFLLLGRFRPKWWLLALFAGAISVNCVLALVQLAGYNPFGLYPAGMTYYDAGVRYAGAFLGTVGNVDILSAALCLAVPLFWAGLVRGETPWRFLLLLPLGLSLTVLGWAFVEGGVLAVGLSALFTLPALAKGRRRRLLLVLLAVMVLLTGVCAVYAVGDRLGGAAAEASALLHGRWDDSFGSGRLYIWRESAKLVPQRPIFGGGPDTLGLRTDAHFQRFNEATGTIVRADVDDAHNEYLDILVNQGLAGLLAYLTALGSTLVLWLRRAPQDKVTAICGAAVFCYAIEAFFGLASPATTPLFWACLALCAGVPAKGDHGLSSALNDQAKRGGDGP